MRGINKLSAAQVTKSTKPGRYSDGGGLYLQVSKFGTKSWLFRYMIGGKAFQMGLGSLRTFSLAEARERAKEERQLMTRGLNPIEERRKKVVAINAADANRVTFRQAAQRFIAAKSPEWKNAKHGAQWISTLETYVFPVIGDLSVAEIETNHVLKILEPIWTIKTETASRVRGRIEKVLDWAAARKLREGENPARWRGHLENLLAKRSKLAKVKHHAALPIDALPGFMERLRGMDSVSARALEFTILTAARTGEAIGATWDEIDLDAKVWTIPADRMKAGNEHRVPLPDRLIAMLESLPHEDEHVFPGGRKGNPLSNMAMLSLLRGMDDADGLTVHGFRSTFRDWAAERTNFPRDIAEAALAHTLRDKTEAAYRRGDVLDKRRRLMTAWANYCAEKPREGQVVSIAEAVNG